jgi:hypothetical protein
MSREVREGGKGIKTLSAFVSFAFFARPFSLR